MAKPVSQSKTMWVKKGTVVNGTKVKKGYVAQLGKPEKRVTNKVKLEVDTAKRGKAGDVVKLKQGKYVKDKPAAPSGGGGRNGRPGTPINPKVVPPKVVPPKATGRTTQDLTAGERNKLRGTQTAPSRTSIGTSAAARKKMQEGRKDWQSGTRALPGPWTGRNEAFNRPDSRNKPRYGQKKTTMAGVSYWDGKKFVPARLWKGKK